MNLLISAYACNPTIGSEPGMGWEWVKRLSESHKLWVLTESVNKQDIEEALKSRPEMAKRVRFYYIKHKRNYRLEKTIPYLFYYRSYNQWHKEAYDLAKRIVAENRIDLVHQLNMIGFREPGYLWKLNNKFVWGPIGGLTNVSLRYPKLLGTKGFLHYIFYNAANSLQLRFSYRVNKAFSAADALIFANTQERKVAASIFGVDGIVIPATSANKNVGYVQHKKSDEGKLKIIWSGLHFYRKGLPLLLYAAKSIQGSVNFEIDIYSNGPLTNRWKRLSKKLGIEDKCNWIGWVDKRDNVLKGMAQGDVYVLTSIREGSPTVLFEALSLGLPVVCLDVSGYSDILDDSCGYLIKQGCFKNAVNDLAQFLIDLSSHKYSTSITTEGCLSRIEKFRWESNVSKMNNVYKSLA